MNDKPSYKKLVKQRQKLLEQLGKWPPVLRACLRLHGNICGTPHCRCKDPEKPKLHGPYHYLSHRYEDRTQTIFLTNKKLHHAQQWIDNYKRLIKTIYELSEINFKLLRYHHDKLEPSDEEKSGRKKQI